MANNQPASSWGTFLWFCSALWHVYAGTEDKEGVHCIVNSYIYTGGEVEGEHSFLFCEIYGA